jgi:hypothetical protein
LQNCAVKIFAWRDIDWAGGILGIFVFLLRSQLPSTIRGMIEPPHLRPATPDEITESLSFALRYDGRKRVRDADDAMARITAERLVRHLERSGFVLMKRPPDAAPAAGSIPVGRGRP